MSRLVNDLRSDFGSALPPLDVDDEYEDEEEQWEDGAEDILEKGEKHVRTVDANVDG